MSIEQLQRTAPMSDLDRMWRIPNKPTHALHVVDNWDGEGDKVLQAWPLG